MARRTSSKNDLIKCEYCGEMYSVTYKHCPFCNEDGTGRWDDPETEEDYYDEQPRKGGKRLAGSGKKKGPTVRSIIALVLSLALIIAAAGIVISILKPLLGGRRTSTTTSTPTAAVSEAPSEEPTESEDVADPTAPAESQTPDVTATTPAAEAATPTGFTLNREDFTFSSVGEVFQMTVTYTPAGTQGEVSWKSSNPNVASVSWNGLVTAVSSGTATLTATVDGVGSKTCIVRCNFQTTTTTTSTATPTAAATSAPTAGSGLTLNREDFTLSSAGETWRLTVSGTSSAVTWSSSNTGVATVSSDGTVTAVSAGTCTVTATVDGTTLKCVVRCSF